MFWLLRRLISLALLIGLIWIILQLDYHGRPVKDRVSEFLQKPLIQEVHRQIKEAAIKYLKKDIQEPGPAMEKIQVRERKELEKVIEKETEEE